MSAAVSLPVTATRIVSHQTHWSKRPRPIVKLADARSLDWDPQVTELYSMVDGAAVRAGDAFAIVRPGLERWPLGIASDRYRITSHRATAAAVVSYCSDLVTPNGIVIAGHGYHVAHGYFLRHVSGAQVDGAPVICKLVVANDHTGEGACRSAMVVYVGTDPLGSIVKTRGLHVGGQPERWHSEIESMTERSILAQDAILDLLRAAHAHVMTDEDRKFFERRKMTIKGHVVTALDAVRAWHAGPTRAVTWGVWERRLDDTAIVALCALLGRQRYGAAIDAVLGGSRYGGAR